MERFLEYTTLIRISKNTSIHLKEFSVVPLYLSNFLSRLNSKHALSEVIQSIVSLSKDQIQIT